MLKKTIKSIFRNMLNPFLEKFISEVSDRRKRVTILSPLIWLVGLILSTCFPYFIFGHELWIKIFCVILIIGAIIYFIRKYEYFSIKDPDRLHTEEIYLALKQTEKMAIQGEKPVSTENVKIIEPPKVIDKP